MNSGACSPPRPKPLSRLPSRPPWPGQRPGTARGPTGNPWVEGMAQNSMDGMEELRLALATLDPKRVAGGKETVADWKRRLSRLEAIIQEAQEESQLQGTLQDLVTQARGHTDPRQLKIVVEAARGLALGASAGSQYALLKDKLLRYASAKQMGLSARSSIRALGAETYSRSSSPALDSTSGQVSQ